MQRKKFLMISSVLLLSITISGCAMFRAPEKQVVVQSVEVERKIPLQSNPKPVTLGDAKYYVVTAGRSLIGPSILDPRRSPSIERGRCQRETVTQLLYDRPGRILRAL